MKKIETIIRPEAFQILRNTLDEFGINGLTVSEVAGCGQQKGMEGIFRGNRFEVKLYPKVKVEMVVKDSIVDEIISVITSSCSTGKTGDGKIFVFPVESVIRIRTGERDEAAIS